MTSRSGQSARTLVTGLRGFTGAYLAEALRGAGHAVVSPKGNAASPADSRGSGFDITSLEQCRRVIEEVRPDYIAHLAAISFVGHANDLEFYHVNVLGTLNLLQACEDVGHTPRKILIASSANVYGNVESDAIDESFPLAPVNHYAASKMAMEAMVRTWFERLPIVITRPFNYTGVGQSERFLVPKIVSHFLRRDPVISLGNIDVARDFSDVRYVAQVYGALLESDVAGETINVCTGQPYSLAQILALCGELTGHEIRVEVNPAFVRKTDVKTLVGSSARLLAQVPEARPIPFDETVRWMLGLGPSLDAAERN
ncbi:GDP-mannose 4,6-dehydratase [Paraburkholderia bannensis]|uniref:GDP-mannose 4,6-dehydratase n=1 Tax=Paraburkholderia bannensis TaxID=765414 RepID=UPI002AC31567|nr:GDP-mannose 4,6-dehydratase [Paraburkholderia bannensis]